MPAAVLSALLALSPLARPAVPPGYFALPFAVTADGAVLDKPAAERFANTNEYPWVGDFDGDGKPDLLVGQDRGDRKVDGPGGRLRVYRNTGERGRPRFGAPAWFDNAVPTGRIPDG